MHGRKNLKTKKVELRNLKTNVDLQIKETGK